MKKSDHGLHALAIARFLDPDRYGGGSGTAEPGIFGVKRSDNPVSLLANVSCGSARDHCGAETATVPHRGLASSRFGHKRKSEFFTAVAADEPKRPFPSVQ